MMLLSDTILLTDPVSIIGRSSSREEVSHSPSKSVRMFNNLGIIIV